MESVWKGASKYNNLTVKQLKAADMVMLSRFICGLDSTEIRQLNIDAFKLVHQTELTSHFQLFKRRRKKITTLSLSYAAKHIPLTFTIYVSDDYPLLLLLLLSGLIIFI